MTHPGPRIVALRYRLNLLKPQASWANPAPLEGERHGLRFRLDAQVLRVDLADPAPNVPEARAIVEPFLRDWTESAGLDGRSIAFEYAGADVDDPSADVATLIEDEVVVMTMTPSAEEAHTIAAYPSPPDAFTVDADVETLLHRYKGYAEGREPRTSWAWFTLSYIEHILARGRKDAAPRFNVAPEVLNAIGFLSADVGDPALVRKISRNWQERPHTGPEWEFLDKATKALIRRVADVAGGGDAASLPRLRLEDLDPSGTVGRKSS